VSTLLKQVKENATQATGSTTHNFTDAASGTCLPSAALQFALHPTAETLAYRPWNTIARHLRQRASGGRGSMGGIEAGVAGLRRGQKHESGPLPSGKEYESPKRFERINMIHTPNEVTSPHPCNPGNRSLADSDCAELGSMTVLRG